MYVTFDMHPTQSHQRSRKRLKHGQCPLCDREVALTFHHFIPKKMHRRDYFRKRFSKDLLNQGIDICRLCHDGIHDLYDEMQLAKALNSLESLMADEGVQRHVRWVSKQKPPSNTSASLA
jgi:hypothetical protein